MRIQLLLPLGSTFGGGDPRTIVDLARRAEDAGVDGVVLAEHIVMGEDVSEYRWGAFPLQPSDPFLEPVALLAAIANVTDKVVLGTGILIAALRPAALLAKQLATVDHLAGPGRLEIGVGTGWHRAELAAHGVPFARRGQVLTDTIRACRALWGPQPATVTTPSFTFGPVYCEPRPSPPNGPAVLFSGTLNERTVARIVELGDGWIPIMGQTRGAVVDDVARLGEAVRNAGRDPSTLRVRVPLPLRKVDGVPSLEATLDTGDADWTGVTDGTIPVAAFVRSRDDIAPFFRRLSGALSGRRTA